MTDIVTDKELADLRAKAEADRDAWWVPCRTPALLWLLDEIDALREQLRVVREECVRLPGKCLRDGGAR